MSRFFTTICALTMATPLLAMASQPTDFQRPDAWRHAINAVIGDASYVDQTGALPPPGTDGDERVRVHLEFVYGLLSRGDVSALPAELREARADHLARLREYIDAGVFPRNRAYVDENRPCFIDDDGRICAVGYLVEQSAGRDVAELINAKFQYSFLPEMKLTELDDWIATSGLSPTELAMIQPNYEPPAPSCYHEYGLEITTSGTTVTIEGVVTGMDPWENSCCGGVTSLVINFGDAIWSSKIPSYSYWYYYDMYYWWVSEWWQPINISHTYSAPGTYAITVNLLSTGNACFQGRTWTVNVDGAGNEGGGDSPPPVATRTTTWGAIKAMYR